MPGSPGLKAGASTAIPLTREPLPGTHSSGQRTGSEYRAAYLLLTQGSLICSVMLLRLVQPVVFTVY